MQFKSLIQEARSLIEGPVNKAEKDAAVQQHTPNILAANEKGFKKILSRGGQVTRGPSGITKTMRVLAARKVGVPPPIPKPKRAPGVPPPLPAAALRPKKPAMEAILVAYRQLIKEGLRANGQYMMVRPPKVKVDPANAIAKIKLKKKKAYGGESQADIVARGSSASQRDW